MNSFFEDEFLETIVNPFFEEVKVRNQLSSLQEYEEFVEKKYSNIKKEDAIALIKNNLFSNKISSFIYEKPQPSNEELSERLKKLLLVETLFFQKVVRAFDFEFSDESKDIFIYLIGIQCYFNSYRSEKITEINIYKEAALKIVEYYKKKEDELSLTDRDKKWAIFLKRSLYLLFHETEFLPDESFYKKCMDFVKDDIEYSKNISIREYLFAILNYLMINIDHLMISLSSPVTYLDKNQFEYYLKEFKKHIFEVFDKETNFKRYKMLLVFFLIEIYNLKFDLKNKKEINENIKNKLLLQCTNLIKAFYGEEVDVAFFCGDKSVDRKYPEVLKEFSLFLSRLLNDFQNNTLDVLFRVFYFLYNFPEYNRLNSAIYNRIQFVSKSYFYRKIVLLSNLMFLKSLNDIERFKTSIISIKNSIESNPIPSLITFYNNEIVSTANLPPNLISFYKADPNIIQIFEKIHFVNKFVFDAISDFKLNFRNDKDFKVKFEFLLNVQNEINNIISVVSDPNLVKDLGQFYCFFIDSYIKRSGMEYREDYINKANLIKFSILDLNPINFSLTLLFSKLGKINFIIYHRNPSKLGIKKKSLTQVEKDEIAGYLDISIDSLPRSQGMFNWEGIQNSFRHLRDPALSSAEVAIPDARILKVLCAILNKITRHDIDVSKLFLILINESYDYARRVWDLDPLIVYYFATYFAKKGRKIFYNENTGKKIEIRFSHLKNSLVNEKINMFIKDMLESIKESDELSEQFDEIMSEKEISLVEETGKLKNIGLLEIRNIIKNSATVIMEKAYFSLYDKAYLAEILSNYFVSVGRSFLTNPIKYIVSELIENANRSNLKRVYFTDRALDIDAKYQIGMSSFMDALTNKKPDYIIKLNEKKDFKIKVSVKIFNENIIISVSNNFKITRHEIEMIDEAIHIARASRNLKDAYKQPLYTKEGKGLGLIMINLFLRKYGLEKECFKLNIKENETRFTITIPYLRISEQEELLISEEITREIDKIPVIPEHVRELEKKLMDPEINLIEIEKLILTDPSLSADIIRIANSSYYMTANPAKTVLEAIKIIGTKGVYSIITVSTSYKLLENRTSKEKVLAIFSHSEQTAFFAKELARILKIDINIDEIYIASLLHDIGKIVVEGINPDVYKNIQNIFIERNIPISVIEDLAGGINHAVTGYLIAEKWKFPSLVSEVIRCHHKPRDARSNPKAVFLVYLANILTYYVNDKIQYENFDINALEYFDIASKDKVDEIASQVKKRYIDSKNSLLT